jgi:hypothetical protein
MGEDDVPVTQQPLHKENENEKNDSYRFTGIDAVFAGSALAVDEHHPEKKDAPAAMNTDR